MLLPTGNVLTWSDYSDNGGVQLWHPATNTFTDKDYLGTDLFCAGQTYLADGRVITVGGILGSDDVGPRDSNIFDPATESWSRTGFMAVGRYYPTATTLGDGRIMVQGGTVTCISCIADIPEIYDPLTGNWTSMATSARKAFMYYPHTYQLPDGRVLVAAEDDSAIATSVLDLNTQKWTVVDSRIIDGHSSVMYLPGKILKAGTATADSPGNPAAATSYTLDMTQTTPAPTWQATATPMAYPRSFLNLTVLPDGQVLATGGGTTTDTANTHNQAVYAAELWSPVTRSWTTMSSEQKPRLYHSTALLLPDATVLVAGGGRQTGDHSSPDPADQLTGEIFSPPYLFKGARPVITSAPAVVSYGAAFSVATPDAARIATVSLIPLATVTHAFNENQRYVPLAFEQGAGSLNVHGPVDGNTAPPGPYMLFLVDTNGVPSIAAMTRLPAPWEDNQPPTPPGNLTANASTGAVSLGWNASTDNMGVTGYNVHRSTTPGFTPTAANRIGQSAATTYRDTNFTTAGAYYYQVTAQDARGNISSPSNEASTAVALDTTPPSVQVTVPTAGATVSANTTVTAAASDDVVIAGVQFLLDGVALGAEVTGPGPTYDFTWLTAQAPNGPHTLSARARDGAGNTALAPDVAVNVANTASVPVAFDAVGPNSAGISVASGSSLSWSHTVTATTANPFLTASVSVGKSGDAGLSLAVSYNGVPMTSAGVVHSNGQNQGYVQLFYLKGPATGTHTVQVTLTGGTADLIGGSVSFTGVDQTNPVRNITMKSGSGTSPNVTVASATGNMVVDALVSGCDGTITSKQTVRWVRPLNCSTAGGNGAQSTATGAASVAMGYTVPSDLWGMIGMDIVSASPNTSPDFTLSESPVSQAVAQGGSTNYGVTITPTGGFNGAVTLSTSGLPSGATASFGTNPATSTSQLSVTTSASTPTGTYQLTITGVNGTLTHTTTATLVVNAPSDFSLSASPASQTIVPGASTSYGVTISPTGGFNGAVTLSASGLPSGAGATFNPNPATSSSTLSLTSSAATPTGTYQLTITGVSGALTHTTTATLVVSTYTMTVTAPNTAVSWQSGSTQSVTFTHNLGAGQQVNIDVSRDGGATWANIGTLTTTGASETYPWLVSGPSTTQARIRVSAASGAASDMSDVNFTIASRITVTAPNTAVTWGAGSTRTITWTHNLGTAQTVDIAFSPDNGATWIPMASAVPNSTSTTGTYTGVVPSVVTTQGRVRVSWTSDPTESDMCDGLVTLAAPAITVTAPNTNVNWAVASAHNITWTHNLGTAESVQIEISRDGGSTWSVIAPSVTNTGNTSGTYSWTVTGPGSTTARARIKWTRNTAVSDLSDVNFKITAPITVTSPNTAVTWAAGSTRTITWTHNLGSAQTFDVDFSADNGATWAPMASGVAAATATTGNYTTVMPATLTTQALVRVSPSGLPLNGDTSNVVFTVAAPAITVTSPNTNVSWSVGSAHNITWTHNLGTAERVTIEVSQDGGSTWSVVAASAANTSSTSSTFSWTVTGPATTTARIRVTWVRDGTVSDVSNVNFRIQ